MVLRYPRLFAKVAPLSGRIQVSQDNLTALANSDIWAVVGTNDKIVDPQLSIDFIEALNSAGNNSRITVLEGDAHFEVLNVYNDISLGLTDWLTHYNQTGVDAVINDAANLSEIYYDLNGRIIVNPTGGFYIYKNKVVLIR